MEESAGNICYGSRAIHIYVVPTHKSVLGVEEHAVTEVVLAADGHGAQHRVQLQQEEAVRGHQHPAAVPALGPGLGHQLSQELVTDPLPDVHHGLATVGETPGQQLSVLDELLHLSVIIVIDVISRSKTTSPATEPCTLSSSRYSPGRVCCCHC